jgi:cytochrome b561
MPRATYHPISVILHWLVFVLFVVALATIEYRGEVPKGEPLRDLLRTIHMHAGQLVFLLVLVRLPARKLFGVPDALPMKPLQRMLAHTVHFLLYFVMIALPITGILFTQAGGKEVVFFGLTLPTLIAQNMDLRNSIRDFHEFMGNAVYFLVGLHVIGALWHHYVEKMPIFRRMMLRAKD